MSSEVVSRFPVKITRPDFYGPAVRFYYKGWISGLIIGVIGGGLFWYFKALPHMERIDNYYKNLDPYERFEQMRAMGVFTSCPPDWVLEERRKKKEEKERKRRNKKN